MASDGRGNRATMRMNEPPRQQGRRPSGPLLCAGEFGGAGGPAAPSYFASARSASLMPSLTVQSAGSGLTAACASRSL